ncbi:hypothetical protein FGG08_004926 [Glutinoglossum americanum]|uniref:Yippee domain-containing protein n=1 Tax=Glutinoglossum americanum TaxID=1670608 RepID=A0A9P8I423_9PEZI|nr:hypothetical protein FGG08_004926 [Glutinoglossum americanum]
MAPFPPFYQRASSGAPSSSSPSSTTHNLIFPTFLLPSIPFRRRSKDTPEPTHQRKANASDTANTANTALPGTQTGADRAARAGGKYLTGHTSTLHCARCSADLCHTSQIISKGFTGRHGRAYLISPPSHPDSQKLTSTLPNTLLHAPTPRHLVTGLHTVSDISCIFCASVLGWKYVAAEEEAQGYKVGKFILETKRVRGGVGWEGGWDDGGQGGGGGVRDGEVEFDSGDEEECEDLFAGVWTGELAGRRRGGRVGGRLASRGS